MLTLPLWMPGLLGWYRLRVCGGPSSIGTSVRPYGLRRPGAGHGLPRIRALLLRRQVLHGLLKLLIDCEEDVHLGELLFGFPKLTRKLHGPVRLGWAASGGRAG